MSTIADKARQVAEQSENRDSAYADEIAAAVELFRRVVDDVRPALASICSRNELLGLTPTITLAVDDEEALYLTEHSTLVSVDRSNGEVDEVPFEGLPDWFYGFDRFWLHRCVGVISDALDRQLEGNSAKRTQQSEKRAARLRAITTLLEG